MKLLPLFLACLLVAAGFNLALDLYQQTRFQALTRAVGAMGRGSGEDERTFDERLAGSDDSAELRKAARTQHVKREDAEHLTVALLGSVNRMNGMATVRSGVLLALALGTLFVGWRPRRGNGSGWGDDLSGNGGKTR